MCSTHLISRLYVFIAGADLGCGAYGDAEEIRVRCAQEFGDGRFSRFVRKRSPFRVLGVIRKILFNRYLMIRRLLLFVVLIGGLSWTAGTQNVTLKTKNR